MLVQYFMIKNTITIIEKKIGNYGKKLQFEWL